MSSNWKRAILGDFIKIKHGYPFKSEFFIDQDNGQILLTPGNFNIKGGLKLEKLKFYQGPIDIDHILSPGDIIVSMTDLSKESDTLGYPARIPKSNYIHLHNQRLGKVIFKNDQINPSFLYYLLCSPTYRNEILASSSGTSVKHTAPSRIEAFKTYLPNLNEQKAIAEIFSTIDEKIELNRHICKIQEDIASTIFKSWFIDFDPVNAKAAGREPEGLNPEIAELFPDTFNSNELPNSWHFSVAYDWAEYINGAAYKDSHFTEAINGLPIIKIAELKSGISSGTKYTNVNLGDKYKIETGNILLSWSGSPETSIDTFLWVGGAGWLNQHIFNVIPKTYESRTFVYFLLKYLKPKLINIAKNKQTTGLGHITVKDLKELKVVNPGSKLIKSFDLIASPILQRIQHSLEDNVYLSMIRNDLLPRLISGSIRLKDI